MWKHKKEAAPAGTGTTSERKTLSKSYQSRLQMSSKALRELRTVHGKTSAEIVGEMRKYYPKFDRSMLSRAENGGKWGIIVSDEILRKVYQALVPDVSINFSAPDQHRLTHRISVRLSDEDYAAVVAAKEKDRVDTMQTFLTELIRKGLADD